jgi:DNA-binding response OmpR family regulator
MKSATILIIEDDDLVARTIDRSLRGEEFKTVLCDNGEDGLRMARKVSPDLVILDVVMPGMDGFSVCREMRADPTLTEVPVLFLTAKIRDDDRIAGFLAGADDYLTKPFNLDELLLRVHAILRRTKKPQSSSRFEESVPKNLLPTNSSNANSYRQIKASSVIRFLVVGEFSLDTSLYELQTPQRGKIRLTPIQFELLYHMMCHPGQVFSPARLLDEVWDYPIDAGSPDLVRVHIKNLRERIEINPSEPTFIRTVPGFGYMIGQPDALE